MTRAADRGWHRVPGRHPARSQPCSNPLCIPIRVRAPYRDSVAWGAIESIMLQSGDDRRACEGDAKGFGNVPLVDFKRESKKALFTKAPKAPSCLPTSASMPS